MNNHEQLDMRHRVCRSLRQLLVTKGQAVVVGVTIKLLITFQILCIFGGRDDPPAVVPKFDVNSANEACALLSITVVTFICVVSISTLMAEVLYTVERLPLYLKSSYAAGIALIPAWGWKDVVAAFFVLAEFFGIVDKDTPGTYVAFAFFIAVFSASIQLTLEAISDHAEKDTLLRCVTSSFMACFTLGVACAVNAAVKVCVGPSRFDKLDFNVCYLVILLLIVPEAQRQVRSRLDKGFRAYLPLPISKGVDFVVTAGDFMLAFAFKGILDSYFADMAAVGVYWPGQLQVTVIVTSICVIVTQLVAVFPLPMAYEDISSLMMAMNLGWTWTVFAKLVIVSNDPDLATVWEYSFAIFMIAVMIMLPIEFAISTVENFDHEATFGKITAATRSYGSACRRKRQGAAS
eukprot:TRINITY_DN1727_c0_g1_i3.p1 TRINITY_DN1727_c0_g1~~TRINITY_DN1727_c0_g1_i3.p1  ORF type:complete len:405 (+),score=48.52 TRINITY_DN1727_c0_g1_i3:66-1280(+)